MTSITTFYFSRVVGAKVTNESGKVLGKLVDLIVELNSERPKVLAAKIQTSEGLRIVDFSFFKIEKIMGQYKIFCQELKNIVLDENLILTIGKYVLDRQIVDMDGRKLVRVNDLRLAVISGGTHLIAADVGVDGIFRRLGVAKPIKIILKPFNANIPSHLILWDEVQAVDFGHAGIKLSKDYSSLHKLHPSDLADIIEDMDSNTQMAVFNSLNDEQATDVLEELEPEAQVSLLEMLSVQKAADLLEMMPADEAADILEELNDAKAEELLNEMEAEASAEVRELMEYADNTVGSIMSTDFICFNEYNTVGETIESLRKEKPESDAIYYLYIIDDTGKLVANVSLRDLIVSDPSLKLIDIMKEDVVSVIDTDSIESLGEMISKYNLLASPVVDDNEELLGMVIINDVIHNLLKLRRKRM